MDDFVQEGPIGGGTIQGLDRVRGGEDCGTGVPEK